jgi:hypothetical protein
MLLIGLLLALMGLADTLTLWLPGRIGVAEWEFGTVSAFFDSFPLLGLGLVFLIGAGLALGRRWPVRLAALACVLIALVMWAAAVLYLTVLPLALKAVNDPVMLGAVKKGIVKTGVQAAVYPFALLWLAGVSWWATVPRRDA